MSSSMPKLPPRKATPVQSASRATGPSAPAGGLHEEMLSQVSNAASNPAIMRLMESPDLLEAVKDRDPMLKRLLEQNPAMSELLAPDKLRSVMEMVKGANMIGGLDTSEQRKGGEQVAHQPETSAALLQMRARMQQLQQHLAAQAAGAAGQRPWASGMPPPHQPPAFFKPPSVGQASMAQGPAGGGGYSFTHSEREVTLGELPYEAQQKLMEAYGMKRDGDAPPGAPGQGSSGPGPDGDGEGRMVALPSFDAWQQEQLAAAARAAQALPPGAWAGLLQAAPRGSVMPSMAHGSAPPAVTATPLPMSTPSRDGGTAGGADAPGAGGSLVTPWLGPGHGHSHGHGGLPAHGSHNHHHHNHHHHTHGGKPCCSGHDHGHGHGQGGHQHMHGLEYGQFGMYGMDGGVTRKVRPRDYYESVIPNLTWRRPEGQEGCGSLYRKAYHSYCDMMLFPPLFAVAALLVVLAPGLPFWLLAVGLVAAVVPGTYCFVVVLAGLPKDRMPTSRSFMSLIATCEVVYPIVFGCRVLPYWHGLVSTPTALLLAGFMIMPVLHLAAAAADPGYVPRQRDLQQIKTVTPAAAGVPQGEDGKAAVQQQDGAVLGSSQQDVEGQVQEPKKTGAAAAGLALGMLGLGMTAPLPDDDGGGGGGAGGEGLAAKAAADWAERQCTTCLVARPMRSKHCQFCNRCVRRFDHHCPAIANCVGEANERSFVAWLFIMWVTQILVVYVAVSFILQRYLTTTGQAAASSAPDTGPAAVWAALCWAAAGPERGLMLLAGLQALCFLPATYLAARQALCILANLTANELINRDRYNYLQDGQGGYCNRFDRGVALNCFSFWLERNSNWRAQYDAGEREMCRRGARQLSRWSVAWLMGWQDDFSARRNELRQAVVDLRKEKARRGAAVRAEAAAAVAAQADAAAPAKKA